MKIYRIPKRENRTPTADDYLAASNAGCAVIQQLADVETPYVYDIKDEQPSNETTIETRIKIIEATLTKAAPVAFEEAKGEVGVKP